MKKFGVEVEFVGNTSAAITQLRASGLAVRDGRHSHIGFSQTEWTIKRDGSVHGERGQEGGEMVSPPLDFEDPAQREQVTKAVQALQDAGCQPHRSAGIHVHIEAKNYDGSPLEARQIAAVVRFTYKFEDAIYRIASSGWQTIRPGARTYAKPIPEMTARAIMEVKTVDELRAVWNGQTTVRRRRRQLGNNFRASLDRYTATNLRAYFDKNTIEFRYFNSSVNPNRVQAYVALCMAMVDDARNGYSRSVKKSYRVGAMRHGEIGEKALMMRLQQVLRSNSKDTQICMSEDDWKNLRKTCWNDSVPQERWERV